MRNIILPFLLLASLVGFSQRTLTGTTWSTYPEWSAKANDSIYYSITFKPTKAVLKCKYKTFARTRIIEEITWCHDVFNGYPGEQDNKIAFTKSWYTVVTEIEDDAFLFDQFDVQVINGVAQTVNGKGEVKLKEFYLRTENTLNGTVWICKNGNKLAFKNDVMFLDTKSKYATKPDGALRFPYYIDGDIVKVKDLQNKIKILPGRESLVFEEPGRKLIYVKVNTLQSIQRKL